MKWHFYVIYSVISNHFDPEPKCMLSFILYTTVLFSSKYWIIKSEFRKYWHPSREFATTENLTFILMKHIKSLKLYVLKEYLKYWVVFNIG